MWQRCRVSYVTGASSWYWLTFGQGLLSFHRLGQRGDIFIYSVSSLSFIFLFALSISFIRSTISISLLLFFGRRHKWSTRVDISLYKAKRLKKIPFGIKCYCSVTSKVVQVSMCLSNTVELQWLEHLWDHRKLFETWVVRATEGCQVRKQITIIYGFFLFPLQ